MDIEKTPHALIAWKEDNMREKVPLTFVLRFPKSWRKQGWDKRYEYSVFWSPNEDDSPQLMLKRVAEIPTFEAGTGREQAGYHRAVVLMVKESLAELDKAADLKRTPVSIQTYTSFDDPKKAEQAMEPRTKPEVKPVVSKPKPIVLKKGTKKKQKSKSKGINLSATAHNAGPELSVDLTRRYNLNEIIHVPVNSVQRNLSLLNTPKESDDDDTEDIEKDNVKDLCANGSSSNSKETVIDRSDRSIDLVCAPTIKTSVDSLNKSSSPIIKTEPVDSENVPHSPSFRKRDLVDSVSSESSPSPITVCHDIAQKTNDIGRTDFLVAGLPDSNPEKGNKIRPASSSSDTGDSSSSSSKPTPPKKVSARGKGIRRRHSSSSDEVSKLDNGEAMDPDFTPRKYVRLREELLIEKQQVKRVLNLNMRLQSKLLEAENQEEHRKQEVETMKAKVVKMEKEIKQLKTRIADAHPNQTPVTRLTTPVRSTALRSPGPTSSPVASNVTPGERSAFKSPTSSPTLITNTQFSSPVVKTAASKPVSPSSDSNDNLSEDWNGSAAKFCDAQLSEEECIQSNNDEKVDIVKPLIDLGIEFSEQRLQAIKSIPRGEKADSRFVKDLLVITFGPEVLASCSKDGSKRGGKRTKQDGKETTPKEKKPALDKTKLAAVREVFLLRVKGEGEEFTDPEALERTNSSTFYKAFSGAQRRCRNLGYGKGLKTNEPNTELFSFI